MYHPTTRVLALLELLQAHGQVSGRELASRLGVNPRTLRRYVARLEELGIPVATEQGRHGGYTLVPGYKLPPLMFTDEEALALSVGLLAARAVGLDHRAPGVAGAQAKLERVMPSTLRERLRAADESVALDLPRQVASPDPATLAVLASAAQQRRRVAFDYVPAQAAPSAREVDLYGLAYRAGCWYAVGHCHLRRGLRTFRVDRVRRARVLASSFERPQRFDTLGHLTLGLATLPRAHAVELLLRCDLDTARRQVFPALGVLEPAPGGVRLSAQADDLGAFARELSRLPFGFAIVRPAGLRRALRAHARELVRRAEP